MLKPRPTESIRIASRFMRLSLDGEEFDAVAGTQKKHCAVVTLLAAPTGVEKGQRRMPDDVPAARRLDWIDAGVFAADSNRAGGDARAWTVQPRSMKPRVEIAQVRKAGREAEKVDFVDGLRMQMANIRSFQMMMFCHTLQIRTIVGDWNFAYSDGRQRMSRHLFEASYEFGHEGRKICGGVRMEFQHDRGNCRGAFNQPSRRMAFQSGNEQATALEGILAGPLSEADQDCVGT